MPWLSGQDYKRLCTWLPYASSVLVLTRDRGSGRITIGRDGLPRVHYWPNAHDRASMMKVSAPTYRLILQAHARHGVTAGIAMQSPSRLCLCVWQGKKSLWPCEKLLRILSYQQIRTNFVLWLSLLNLTLARVGPS
jgi:hypothetical protein